MGSNRILKRFSLRKSFPSGSAKHCMCVIQEELK